MRSHLPLFALLVLLVVVGCVGPEPGASPTASDGTPSARSATATGTVQPTTEPATTANVGTGDRPWDVKVWNMRTSAYTATIRIEQNETGTVVFERELSLDADESEKLTFDYPAAGDYTMTVTVVASNATGTTATTVPDATQTATTNGSGTTVTTYAYEILSVPPSVEVIVLLEDDGGIDIYLESA
jgi:hypothetical protein